jgi:hypothetical protein
MPQLLAIFHRMPHLSKVEVTGQVLVEVPSLRAIIRPWDSG